MSGEEKRLVPCASCARHHRVTEASCPFCGATVASVGLPAAVRVPLRRARVAITAAGAIALTACSSGEALYGGVPVYEDGGTDASDGSVMALYGGPPGDASPGADASDANPLALYGGPPPTDTGPG